MRQRWYAIAALTVGVVFLGGRTVDGTAQEAGTPAAATAALLQPTVGLIEAQELAVAGRTGAVVRAMKLEGEDEALAYEVKLTAGEDLEVDATSGRVRETERGDGRAPPGAVVGTPLLRPVIGLVEAQERALMGLAGAAVRAVKLGSEDATLAYEVELTTGRAVAVDATTGQVRPVVRGDDGAGSVDEDDG